MVEIISNGRKQPMTQTNTTQNKEELEARDLTHKLLGIKSYEAEMMQKEKIDAYIKVIAKSLSQAHQSGIEEGRRDYRAKIKIALKNVADKFGLSKDHQVIEALESI